MACGRLPCLDGVYGREACTRPAHSQTAARQQKTQTEATVEDRGDRSCRDCGSDAGVALLRAIVGQTCTESVVLRDEAKVMIGSQPVSGRCRAGGCVQPWAPGLVAVNSSYL